MPGRSQRLAVSHGIGKSWCRRGTTGCRNLADGSGPAGCPPHIRAVIAGYFTLDADHPAALRALADANRLYRGDSYDPVPVRLAQAFARTRRRVTRRLFGAASRSG